MNKKWLFLILIFFAFYLLKTEWWDKPAHVTVIGEGKIKVKAEAAQLTIGVTNLSTASAQAITGNNLKIKSLKDTLKTFGVEEKEIAVGSFKVNPVSSQNVYQGVNSVNLTFNNLPKLDELIKSLKAQNYQNIAVKYTLKNPDQADKQLFQTAIKDGRQKAQEQAKALGKFWVGRVVSITSLSDGEETKQLQPDSEVELSKTASIVFELY